MGILKAGQGKFVYRQEENKPAPAIMLKKEGT